MLRYDWVWASSYTPHGPVHAWVGGVGGGGCDEGSGQFDKLVYLDSDILVGRGEGVVGGGGGG